MSAACMSRRTYELIPSVLNFRPKVVIASFVSDLKREKGFRRQAARLSLLSQFNLPIA
jgi:hypothetical protein